MEINSTGARVLTTLGLLAGAVVVGRVLAAVATRRLDDQALGNLVDNALHHGAGPITLDASAVDGKVELRVRDRGPGFPTDFLSRAFERFTRPDDARTTGGAGLGLAIVDAIARAHAGEAQVHNRRDGSGAYAVISIPIRA